MSEYEKAKKAAEFGMQTDSVGYDECILIGNLTKAADAEITRLQENQLPDWLMHKSRKVDVRNLKECIKQQESEITRLKEELKILKRLRCRGARDGECIWEHCPQLRDGEPEKSGRHCPLDYGYDDEC